MDRRDFGLWGLDLAPEDFARALAALGVGWAHFITARGGHTVESVAAMLSTQATQAIAEEGALSWGGVGTFDPGGLADQERYPPARVLAAAWSKFIPPFAGQIRLEITDFRYIIADRKSVSGAPLEESEGSFWLVEQLSLLPGELASVYVRFHTHFYEVGWNWPLRIGFLTDPASQQLRQQLRQNYWAGRLFDLVNLEAARDGCDLLLLPASLRDGLAAVLAARLPMRADCVLLLGRIEDPPDVCIAFIKTLLSQIQTGGVGLAYVPTKDRASWFGGLLDELAHNQPFDVALQRSCRGAQARGPMLFASHRLVRLSRVSRQIERLSERFLNLAVDEGAVHISDKAANDLGLDPGLQPIRSIGKRLSGKKPDDFRWDHESDTGSAAAELEGATRGPLESAAPPEPEARWIQAQVWDKSEPKDPQLLRRALRAHAPHAVGVRIGGRAADWVAADAPFPDVPADRAVHELAVVFLEPHLMPEPQTATIVLPPAGHSSLCEFFLQTGDPGGRIEARITVLYENRVLQTALLRAPVVAAPAEATADCHIEVAIEAVIRPGMSGLSNRSRFDAALVLNHDAGKAAGVTKIADRRASFVAPEDLDKETKWFDDRLSEIADDPDRFKGGLEGEETVKMLRDFAIHGSLLYESIVCDRCVDDAIAAAPRIQVIAAEPEARLPIEFLYDREPPEPHAGLCPHAARALADGDCSSACPFAANQGSVICPLGFWGLNRVIERHAHDKEFTSTSPNWDFTLQAEPVATRPALNFLSGALLGASQRVDKKTPGGILAVESALETAVKHSPKSVRSWDDWASEIAAGSPSLLVLLVHTEFGEDELQKIEIGEDAWLGVGYVKDKYVRSPKTRPAPLVLLIGCETGAPKVTFHSFVAKFRRSGAAVIVSTGSTILGRHAIPVTLEFVRELSELAGKGEASFGDVMLRARRKLLANGAVMALCLTAYGDADWRLRPAQ